MSQMTQHDKEALQAALRSIIIRYMPVGLVDYPVKLAVDDIVDLLAAIEPTSTSAAVDEDGLLPCPFCGGEAIHQSGISYIVPWGDNGEGEVNFILCTKCDAIAGKFETSLAAKEFWNTRTTPPDDDAKRAFDNQVEYIKKLKEQLARYREALEWIATQEVRYAKDGYPYSEVDEAREHSVRKAKQALNSSEGDG